MIWITTPTATLFYFNVPALLWAGVKRKMVNFSFSVCEWIVSDCSALLQNIVFCFHDEMKNKQLSSRSLEVQWWKELFTADVKCWQSWQSAFHIDTSSVSQSAGRYLVTFVIDCLQWIRDGLCCRKLARRDSR